MEKKEFTRISEPRKQRRRILVFTASWCAPCRRFREEIAPKLRAEDWKIGTGPNNHLQYVDVSSGLPEGIEALPTFVLIEDGRELRRRVGELDQWEIGELYKGYSEKPREKSARKSSQISPETDFVAPVQTFRPILQPAVPFTGRNWGGFPSFCTGNT